MPFGGIIAPRKVVGPPEANSEREDEITISAAAQVKATSHGFGVEAQKITYQGRREFKLVRHLEMSGLHDDLRGADHVAQRHVSHPVRVFFSPSIREIDRLRVETGPLEDAKRRFAGRRDV